MVSQRRDADAPKDSPKSILESLAGTRVLVVEARYYDDIADELLAGARAAIEAVGAEARVFTVPGALEIPAAIAILMDAGRKAGGPYDAAVALGCVIRGETPHFEYVAGEAARGLGRVALAHGLPVGFGVLTTESLEQALARAGGAAGNKGYEAAEAALRTGDVLAQLTRAAPRD